MSPPSDLDGPEFAAWVRQGNRALEALRRIRAMTAENATETLASVREIVADYPPSPAMSDLLNTAIRRHAELTGHPAPAV